MKKEKTTGDIIIEAQWRLFFSGLIFIILGLGLWIFKVEELMVNIILEISFHFILAFNISKLLIDLIYKNIDNKFIRIENIIEEKEKQILSSSEKKYCKNELLHCKNKRERLLFYLGFRSGAKYRLKKILEDYEEFQNKKKTKKKKAKKRRK